MQVCASLGGAAGHPAAAQICQPPIHPGSSLTVVVRIGLRLGRHRRLAGSRPGQQRGHRQRRLLRQAHLHCILDQHPVALVPGHLAAHVQQVAHRVNTEDLRWEPRPMGEGAGGVGGGRCMTCKPPAASCG